MKRVTILAVLALMLTGCCNGGRGKPMADETQSTTAPVMTLRDDAGAVVLRGTLALPALPPAGKTVEGRWELIRQAESFPDSAVAGRVFVAEQLEDGRVRIDLSPRMRDNNVVLTGTRDGDALRGRWSHLTFAGPREGGPFELATGGK